MPPLVALVSLFVIAQPGLAPTPVHNGVRLESKIVECPSAQELQAALDHYLGSGEESADGWVLSYDRDPSVSEQEGDRSLVMEFLAPTGQRLVSRRIPATSRDCQAIASAMAAVVELSLHRLGWTRGEPLPASTQRSPAPEPSRPVAQERPASLILGVGPSIRTSGTPWDTGINLLLEARGCAGRFLCLRLSSGLLADGESQSVGSGTAHMTRRYLTAAPQAVFEFNRVEIAGGPSLLLDFDHADSDGISQVDSGDRETLGVGVALSVAVRLSARWRLSAGLEGFHAVRSVDFFVEVDGQRAVVFSSVAWHGMAFAQLEFVAWP
jgi:hypothetical protein